MRKRTTTVVEHGISPGFAMTAAGLVLALGVVTGQLGPDTIRTIRRNLARSWAIWTESPRPLEMDARIVDGDNPPFTAEEGGAR